MAALNGYLALGVLSAAGVFTEISGAPGYARQAISLNATYDGFVEGPSDVVFPTNSGSAAWSPVNAYAVYDAVSAGSLLFAWNIQPGVKASDARRVLPGHRWQFGRGALRLQFPKATSAAETDVVLSKPFLWTPGGLQRFEDTPVAVGLATRALRELLATALDRPSLEQYGFANPLYIAHRGSGFRYPEYSMTSYRAAYEAGLRVLEQDCIELLGNGVAVLHDNTVDRTTTATGNVSTFTPSRFRQLTMDTDEWFRGGYGNLKPCLLSEVIAEFKGKIIFVPEAKTDIAGARLVKDFVAAGVDKDQVLVTGGALSNVQPAIEAGYNAAVIMNGSTDKATMWAAGVRYAILDADVRTDQEVSDFVASGFKVIMYPVARRWRRDKYLALGVHGFYSDDVEYLQANKPIRSVDRLTSQKWDVGMIGFNDLMSAGNRGELIAPDGWGSTATSGALFVLQGYACPIKGAVDADTFSVEFAVRYDSASAADRWAGIFIADKSMQDRQYTDTGQAGERGYLLVLRKSGTISTWRRTETTATALQSATSAAIDDGTTVSIKVDVTPTTIVFSRMALDGSVVASVTISDSTYRGGYIHFGRNGLACKFSQVVVS